MLHERLSRKPNNQDLKLTSKMSKRQCPSSNYGQAETVEEEVCTSQTQTHYWLSHWHLLAPAQHHPLQGVHGRRLFAC